MRIEFEAVFAERSKRKGKSTLSLFLFAKISLLLLPRLAKCILIEPIRGVDLFDSLSPVYIRSSRILMTMLDERLKNDGCLDKSFLRIRGTRLLELE